jgi:adenylate cyclase
MDDIVVKGKKDPVKIYELIHPMVLPREEQLRSLVGEFHAARESYRNQDWLTARKHLSSCLQIRPNDGPSKVYLERIDELEKMPRIENWDGVHIFHHK